MKPSSIQTILQAIGFESDVEITLECNPGTIEEDLDLNKLKQLKSIGVNRLSFGAQSFYPDKLNFLGRWHKPEQIEKSVSLAKKAGFTQINIDLIFATKLDTPEVISLELSNALKLDVDHLSTYSLSIEKGTPFARSTDNLQAKENDFADQYEQISEVLCANGYHHYEVSNFFRNQPCLHNLNYWQGGDYLGLGPSASGLIGNQRYQNAPALNVYSQKIADKVLPSAQTETLGFPERKYEYLFLRLRTKEGIKLSDYRKRFEKELVVPQHLGELLELTKEYAKPTSKGFLLSDSLVSELISYN